MEYGLENNFKIYSGGLGILAGDLIKAARDADYPMVAVGILWRQGYTIQTIGENGLPVDAFPEYRYPFLKDTGVTVEVTVKESAVRCKVWLCDCFGNIPLYLLDTFLPDNPESLVTGQLYGWFEEERLAQEIVLGVGGVRALAALGVKPDLYHFNEGHAALAGLELMNLEIAKAERGQGGATGAVFGKAPGAALGKPRAEKFRDAWEAVRKKIVFTTHTPVIAGNEFHGYRALFYTGADLGFTKAELKQIGGDPFNMTVAGLRLSRASNAVAELHAVTANKMWAGVRNASKITSVTNGVHNGTWQDQTIADEARAAIGEGAGSGAGVGGGTGGRLNGAAQKLWERHCELKNRLFDEIETRNHVRLDPDCLTIGFARRAAPYKRSDLIFRDAEKIEELLGSGKLQIVFSGKAHPNDQTGKQIVSNLARMAEKHPGKVVFLQNYDMVIGQLMTRGCDVWLNNPVRPQEASGTSGMKAAMNGVLNFSVLDGWWPEGCVHGKNGWQIGGGYEGENQDQVDADSLYQVLTGEIIPTFYGDRAKWADMMAKSVEMSQHKFSAARMLDDYLARLYKK
jgi:starch phosphorylase